MNLATLFKNILALFICGADCSGLFQSSDSVIDDLNNIDASFNLPSVWLAWSSFIVSVVPDAASNSSWSLETTSFVFNNSSCLLNKNS